MVAFFIATLMLVTDVGDKHDGNKFEILMTDVANILFIIDVRHKRPKNDNNIKIPS